MADNTHREKRLLRGRSLALLIVGVFIGSVLITPVTAHVGGWVHNWRQHIRPLADKRYYTKTQVNNRTFTRAQANNRFVQEGKILSAVVRGNGTLSRGSGVVSSESIPGAGNYVVIFDRNIRDCAWIATLSRATEVDDILNGEIGVSPRAGNMQGLRIRTRNSDNTSFEDRDFHLLVVC